MFYELSKLICVAFSFLINSIFLHCCISSIDTTPVWLWFSVEIIVAVGHRVGHETLTC